MADYTDEQRKVKELIAGDIASVSRDRADLKKSIKDRRAMYDSALPNRQYFGRANVRVPFPWTWAQSMLPHYMTTVGGFKAVLDAYPRGGNNFEKTLNVKRLLNFQLIYEMEFFPEALMFFTANVRDGLAFQKIKWDHERQTGEFHLIDANDFACDPRTGFLSNKTRWVAHIIGKTKEELLEGVQTLGYNPKVVEEIVAKSASKTMSDGVTQLSEQRAVYNIWEWWGRADIGEDLDQEGNPVAGPDGQPVGGIRPVICHFYEDKLLSARTSVYGSVVPFVGLADVHDPFRLFKSKSELDPIKTLYEASSDILNQRLDNVTMGINGFWTILKNSGLDVSRMVSSPWGVMFVNDHDDIRRWESQDVTQNAYQEIPALGELMKLSSGLQDVQRGTGVRGVGTASGLELVDQNASQRPDLKVTTAQHLYIRRVGEILLQEDKMFMSEEKAIRDIGNPEAAAEMFSPDNLAGVWDICPVPLTAQGEKAQRIGQLTNYLNVLNSIPMPTLRVQQRKEDIIEEVGSLLEVKHQVVSDGELDDREAAALQVSKNQLANTMKPPPPNGPAGPQATPGMANNPGTAPVGAPGRR